MEFTLSSPGRIAGIMLAAILPICLLVAIYPAHSAEPSQGKSYSLDQLSWMAGCWRAEAFGGQVEESWDRPWDGSMIGTFKSVAGGNPSFYEFMSITLDSTGVPVLRVKHFNPDFTGWEEKDQSTVFKFMSLGEKEVKFDGISYQLLSEDSLRIIVNLGHSEGATREMTIECHKAPR